MRRVAEVQLTPLEDSAAKASSRHQTEREYFHCKSVQRAESGILDILGLETYSVSFAGEQLFRFNRSERAAKRFRADSFSA